MGAFVYYYGQQCKCEGRDGTENTGRNIYMSCKTFITALALSASVGAVTTAQAQQSANEPANYGVGEIIVTAQKRSESINDIGMSIAAISGSELQDRKLGDLSEVITQVPGLTFAASQYDTPIITLRGVGFNEVSLGVYPATSLYVDEVPLPFPAMAAHSSFDLERVEVLKGPQGVLFGSNSTGGAVNFIAAKPTSDLSAGFDVSFGRFNTIEGNAYISAPLGDKVGVRLAATGANGDAWQKSNSRDEKNGKKSYIAGRLMLEAEPSDSVRLTAVVTGWKDKSDPLAMQFVAATPKSWAQAPGIAAAQNAVPFSPEKPRAADWSPIAEPNGDRDFWQASLRGEFDLSDTTKLTAIAAHSEYNQDLTIDSDGSPLNSSDVLQNIGEVKSTFFEARLDGQLGALRWLVGGNYENSDTYENPYIQFVDNTSNQPQGFHVNRTLTPNDQAIESYAFFGNLELEATDQLTVKAGARYTNTKIDSFICNSDPGNAPGVPDVSLGSSNPDLVGLNANAAYAFNVLGGLSGRPFDPIGVGDCFVLDGPVGQGIPGPFYGTLKEDNVSWRVGADYKLNPDTLLYLNVSKGYKAGSFPTIAASTSQQLQPVTQESVLAFEGGVKASFADRRIHLNTAAFYYDYKDKQVRNSIVTFFGPLPALTNVPKSRIWGIEGELTAAITPSLTFRAAGTYLNTRIKKFSG
ncbi:MAG: TonB-dependent receptor, partial [Novosphingobium sp.]|nr:TonB-dependent receptor [Novosphingobium sp.]